MYNAKSFNKEKFLEFVNYKRGDPISFDDVETRYVHELSRDDVFLMCVVYETRIPYGIFGSINKACKHEARCRCLNISLIFSNILSRSKGDEFSCMKERHCNENHTEEQIISVQMKLDKLLKDPIFTRKNCEIFIKNVGIMRERMISSGFFKPITKHIHNYQDYENIEKFLKHETCPISTKDFQDVINYKKGEKIFTHRKKDFIVSMCYQFNCKKKGIKMKTQPCAVYSVFFLRMCSTDNFSILSGKPEVALLTRYIKSLFNEKCFTQKNFIKFLKGIELMTEKINEFGGFDVIDQFIEHEADEDEDVWAEYKIKEPEQKPTENIEVSCVIC